MNCTNENGRPASLVDAHAPPPQPPPHPILLTSIRLRNSYDSIYYSFCNQQAACDAHTETSFFLWMLTVPALTSRNPYARADYGHRTANPCSSGQKPRPRPPSIVEGAEVRGLEGGATSPRIGGGVRGCGRERGREYPAQGWVAGAVLERGVSA